MNVLIKKLKDPEVWKYLIFGVLATIVSLSLYELGIYLGLNYMAAHIISWVITVLFAFVTNKLFVFNSRDLTAAKVFKELSSFVAARLFSLGVETVIIVVCVEKLLINEHYVKWFTQVIVVLLNYFFSKWFIFKKK